MESKLFTPVTFGPLTLRNRTIRSAVFESMCPGNAPSDMLLDYHRSVAADMAYNLDAVLDGDLQAVIDSDIQADEAERLANQQ